MDVLVVGSGAVGVAASTVFTEAGMDVLMLEEGDHPEKNRLAVLQRATKGEGSWQFPPWRYETEGADMELNTWAIRVGGGSTNAWGGTTPRLMENDFRLKTTYGVGADWPISYDDLEPYYCKAEKLMGVSGQPDNPWDGPRSEPFPMKAFEMTPLDLYVKEACDKIGITIHTFPCARNSEPYGGRSRCLTYAFCHACPVGAMYSAYWTLRDLEKKPNFSLKTRTYVQKVEIDANGAAKGVHCIDRDGNKSFIECPRIILATHALQNSANPSAIPMRCFP